MTRISDIIDKVASYHPETDLGIIDQAYVYSAQVHAGQVRMSGEAYLSHPLEVANILADMKLDTISISAGLLHDVVEDTHATEEDILKLFGSQVHRAVSLHPGTQASRALMNSSTNRKGSPISSGWTSRSFDSK